MKLLIITQKVDKNDGVLSFMIGWIKEFAKQCERVTVIALYVGEHDLPSSVKVLSLGKESGASRFLYVVNFFRYIVAERNNYDCVFVHMNQIYMALGGLLWRIMGKRTALWYAHGSVPWSLRIAEKFAHAVITSTPSGFRLKSNKLHIIGQGINTELFTPVERSFVTGDSLRLLIVGRISPSKDYATLLHAFKILHDKGMSLTLDIVGGAGSPEQEAYFADVKQLTKELGLKDVVRFHGAVPHNETVAFMHASHVFVSTAVNGSFDKAMGDAMATALPVVACNEAMEEVFGDLAETLMFTKGDAVGLVATLEPIIGMSQTERNVLGSKLRTIIDRDHSLHSFVKKVLACY